MIVLYSIARWFSIPRENRQQVNADGKIHEEMVRSDTRTDAGCMLRFRNFALYSGCRLWTTADAMLLPLNAILFLSVSDRMFNESFLQLSQFFLVMDQYGYHGEMRRNLLGKEEIGRVASKKNSR